MAVETRHPLRFDAFIHGELPCLPIPSAQLNPPSLLTLIQRVPKELISRFVKICPTCQVRRGGSRLTPPNSRRGSPRLELLTRSPKLLSPPISRRDSAFGGPLPLGKSSQPDYLGQFDDHNAWVDGGHHQTLHGRSGINPGHVRSFGTGSLGSLPNSISATLDSFSGDLPVPSSHISYGSGFHGSSGHRGF